MRNEAANIDTCLSSLVAQDYPRERVHLLAVDDHSSDDSTEIVSKMAKAQPQITLMRSPPLQPGWIGKSHACWIGAQAAPPEVAWVCFMDADVRAQPALIASAVQQVFRENLDFLSLAPRQDLRSFAERLVMPCGLFLLAFYQDLARVQAGDSSEATATGQFMLIKRQSYDQAGGHAAVRSAICEDLELARRMKRSGGKVVLRGGERLISTRMYTGWRTLWPGLAKNVVDLLGGPLATVFTALAGFTLAWSAVLIPGLEAARYAHGSSAASLPAVLAAAATAAVIALHVAGTRYFRIPLWYVSFSDGTRASAGDRLIDLHLWNEQVPIMPREGASLAWARRMHLCFLYSLQALAQYLNSRYQYNEVSILRATLGFGASEQTAQVVRLMSRYGFEPASGSPPIPVMQYARRVGENLLISLMVLAHNGPALRRDTLRRDRIHVFLSRQMLEQRYGSGPVKPSPKRGQHLC